MARLVEEVLVIKLSKLVRDNEDSNEILSGEAEFALEQVTQELVGTGVLVEVAKA